ncbi:hypothetical protein TRFO_09649 [Tritrichomonas foetus]|uniref:Non-structural maintenance of chromosomes element 1 homolog n=1 Tax=Tritrichomonas foetus TaxID=1144522 RepID=A0A1J4JEK3_9EUKA|nr:hypothetical protein TRFO_09649 [Tritrichomonas foetus]|eukprot:OHS97089.1 hypothetical protein TRFO_09649 [Tritrichomonas foetus]
MSNKSINIRNTIIQTLFTKPYFTKEELQNILRRHEIPFDSFIKDTTELLHHLGFELRSIISDYTDATYYGICQTLEDSSASESLGLKAEQVQLYFRFIDSIINSARDLHSSVTIGEVLDLAPPEMAQSFAQETINKFCQIGCCEKRGDRIRIGPRGILEFKTTFSQLAAKDDADIHSCTICLDFMLAGIKCAQCNCFIHKRCVQSLNQDRWECPVCKNTDPYVEFGM